jgi:hypothetical protein
MKLTRELKLIDHVGVGYYPHIKVPGGPFEDQMMIGNHAYGHHYSKLYRLDGNIINFRTLWYHLQLIDLNVSFIKYNDVVYHVENGFVNITLDPNILENLLWRIHDTGSLEGDREIIINLYNNFLK